MFFFLLIIFSLYLRFACSSLMVVYFSLCVCIYIYACALNSNSRFEFPQIQWISKMIHWISVRQSMYCKIYVWCVSVRRTMMKRATQRTHDRNSTKRKKKSKLFSFPILIKAYRTRIRILTLVYCLRIACVRKRKNESERKRNVYEVEEEEGFSLSTIIRFSVVGSSFSGFSRSANVLDKP